MRMIPSFTTKVSRRASTSSNQFRLSEIILADCSLYFRDRLEAALPPNSCPFDCGMAGCSDHLPDASARDNFSTHYECGTRTGGLLGVNPTFCLRSECEGCPRLASSKCLSGWLPLTAVVRPPGGAARVPMGPSFR